MGTEDKGQERTCTRPPIQIHKCVSVLPNDYKVLENIPTINGVSLIGDMDSKTLGLLSLRVDDYETISLLNGKPEDGKYVLVLGESDVVKVPLVEFATASTDPQGGGSFTTTETVDPDIPVGSYQFVEITE